MKRLYFTIISLIVAITISAQTIRVYEYDNNGNLSNAPVYTSSKKVKVIFTDEKEHEYVDLGLPSGTLWATCNIGASKPEEYGDYFAWGETTPKDIYDWSNYKWMNTGQSSWEQINKYTIKDGITSACWYNNGQFVGDGKKRLEEDDDAATVNWGSDWCMPTQAQLQELINPSYTTIEDITINGIYLRKITSKVNGNIIILPAGGARINTTQQMNNNGYYWSCELYDSNTQSAWLQDYIAVLGVSGERFYGLNVRPIRRRESFVAVSSITLNKSSLDMYVGDTEILSAKILPANASDNTLIWKSSNTNIATVDANGKITAKTSGSVKIRVIADSGSGISQTCTINVKEHEYVDLELPSGTLWAACNVGASKPEEYGDYFAWGETTPKNEYSYSNYKWCNGSNKTFTKYCTSSSYGTVDNKIELDPDDDAATINWGGNWRIPTEEQIKELYNSSYTTTEWTTLNGISGRMITSKKNGKNIFLPAAGYYLDTSRKNTGFNGSFTSWSRSINKSMCSSSYMLFSNSDQIKYATIANRCYGLSVRAVKSNK